MQTCHLSQIPCCLHDIGSAYRFCSSTGDWGPTIVTECESYLVRYLADQVPCAVCSTRAFLYMFLFIHWHHSIYLISWIWLYLKYYWSLALNVWIEHYTFHCNILIILCNACHVSMLHTNMSGFAYKCGHGSKSWSIEIFIYSNTTWYYIYIATGSKRQCLHHCNNFQFVCKKPSSKWKHTGYFCKSLFRRLQ